MNTSSFFNTLFENAKHNSILILDKEGTILNINKAFSDHFGYQAEDLAGKNFSVLFLVKDQETNKPEREVREVLTRGSSNDENYLVHKDGYKIWVAGESVLAEHENKIYLVKIVHNIHAQKQLERFLLQSHEFVDTVFESIKESALMILDSHLRVVKVNKAFIHLFELEKAPQEGGRIIEIENPFWQRGDVKQDMISFLVSSDNAANKIFDFTTQSGDTKKLDLRAKLIEGTGDVERKLLVMIKVADNA